MSIKPECDLRISTDCEGELEEAGALLFSPPKDVPFKEDVKKLHACIPCWKKLIDLIGEARKS